jgi:hypothetical protein
MAVSDKPWGQFSDSDYEDARSFCNASLINTNTGPEEGWSKGNCKLRVNEPTGDLNRNGVHAAAAALAGARGGVKASPAEKRSAARKLMSIYRSLHEMPPDSIRRMAG